MSSKPLSKTGTALVGCLAGVFVILGILMINDDYNKRFFACDNKIDNVYSYTSCVSVAQSEHDKQVNMGWGITIVASAILFVAVSAFAGIGGNKQPKRH